MACNGSHRDDVLSRLPDRSEDRRSSNTPINAFDGQEFPTMPFYTATMVPPDGRRLVSDPRLWIG